MLRLRLYYILIFHTICSHVYLVEKSGNYIFLNYRFKQILPSTITRYYLNYRRNEKNIKDSTLHQPNNFHRKPRKARRYQRLHRRSPCLHRCRQIINRTARERILRLNHFQLVSNKITMTSLDKIYERRCI